MSKEKQMVKGCQIQLGSLVKLGTYPQIANSEPKKVSWTVVKVSDDKALLLSRYGLDCKAFNDEANSNVWENSTLRNWLNNEFYNTCFSADEKKLIIKNEMLDDNVFILSKKEIEEMHFLSMAVLSEDKKTVRHRTCLSCAGTQYCYEKGAYKITKVSNEYDGLNYCPDDSRLEMEENISKGNGKCLWWIRSSGKKENYVACVREDIDSFGRSPLAKCVAVRPAMWISIK